jgi:lysophospholipase L1-like esterase
MGLGASTVFGQESAGKTGWRPSLRANLAATGNPVNFVGSQRTGDMIDNDVEAYPGARIDVLYGFAQEVVKKMKPNLAIVYMGSNDNFQNASLPLLYKRYYAFVNFVLTASPRSTVVMGTLMPTTETQLWGGQDRVGGCNQQLRRLYQVFKREGKPVVLVEMDDSWGIHIENLGPDHMHPSKAGYEIMSRKFWEGILQAEARGFLQAPEHVEGMVDDGQLERLDQAVQDRFEREKTQKEEAERIEEEAIEQMISELQREPWDGKPAVDKPVLPIPERPGNKNP